MRILPFLFMFCSLVFSFGAEPIDLIYTWVDGSDPNWRALKQKHLNQTHQNRFVAKNAFSLNRYQDHQELKYSLRSIHAYAPFIHKIYIVTMGQKPRWLKDHPKIQIVDHSEIFIYKEHLPTFNSLAIESHLHRIANLSERYLYLNDDYFLNKPLRPDDLYNEKGQIKEVFDFTRHFIKGDEKSLSGAQRCLQNTQDFLDKLFGKELRPYPTHSPHPQLRSLVNAIEKKHPFIFYNSSSEKFRGGRGFSIMWSFLQHYALKTGFLVPSSLKEHTEVLKKKDLNFHEKLNNLLHSDAEFISIQDEFSPNEEISKALNLFLEKKFPNKAPWEK